MNLLAWLLIGIAVFIMYSAYKGKNPLTSLSQHLGTKKP